jgi:hypothetical protein
MTRGAHLFVLSIDVQAGLEPVVVALAVVALVVVARNGAKFSQCSMAWGGFPPAWSSGCQKILVDALFPLDGGRRGQ